MKKANRLLSTVLAGMMILSSIPMTASAAIKSPSGGDTTFPDYYPREAIVIEDEDTQAIKVEALVKTMTDAEKFAMLGGDDSGTAKLGNPGYMVGVPRLGVPENRMHDGPAGVTSIYETTGFPTEMSLGATWSEELAGTYGEILGADNVSISANVQLGTQLDMNRSPHFARTKDTMGEDPYLTSQLGVELIKGVQSEGSAAMIKHFAAYGTNGDGSVNLEVDEQTLHEIYFPAFEAAIKEGDAAAVMTTYNKFRGEQTSHSAYLQKDILRDEWGFLGATCCDWGGCKELCLAEGQDIEMASANNASEENVRNAIANGELTWDDVDNAIRHTMYMYAKAGYLYLVEVDAETGLCKEERNRTEVIKLMDTYEEDTADGDLQDANNEAVKEIAEKGGVLLKNENAALPLTESDYTGDNAVAMIGLGAVNQISGIGAERSFGVLKYMESPYDAVKEIAGEDANIVGEVGLDIVGDTVPEAVVYQDEEGDATGWVRSYGILKEDQSSGGGFIPGQGGTGVINPDKDEAGNIVMPNHEIGETAGVDATIDFTTGGKSFKNLENGNAWDGEKDAYTWTGYLEAPETGTYTLNMQCIGGNINGKIYGAESVGSGGGFPGMGGGGSDSVSLGSPSSRQSAQWGWNSIVTSPSGMDIIPKTVKLEAGKRYKVVIAGQNNPSDLGDNEQKDMQIKLTWITPSQKQANYDNAVAAASKADKVLFFAYHNREPFGAGNDISLPEDQKELLKDITAAVQANGGQLIVVLNTSSAIAIEDDEGYNWANDADAILEMWFPGQSGGVATANLLTGKANPSGKLNISFPLTNTDTVLTASDEINVERAGDTSQREYTANYTEGIYTGYRYYDKDPDNTNATAAFTFGEGLSYTTFAYSDMTVTEAEGETGFDVSFTVTNTGDVAGDEVAQVYLGEADVPDGVQMAVKKLAGFARLENMEPGESRDVTIHINKRSLSYWDTNSAYQVREDGTKDKWIVAEGERNVYVSAGAADDDILLTQSINVVDKEKDDEAFTNVSYSMNVNLSVDGVAQPIADLIGGYDAEEAATLKFVPALNGREIAGVKINGEAADLSALEDFDGSSFTYAYDPADGNVSFVFTIVDKTYLCSTIDAAVEELAGIEEGTMVESVQAKIEAAIAAAETVRDNLSATQNEIDGAWSDLLDAMEYFNFVKGDKTYLNKLIAMAEKVDYKLYTTETAEAFRAALKNAKTVAADDEALKDDVAEAVASLTEAMTSLVRKADMTSLNTVIEEAESKDLSKYTEESAAALTEALAAAKAVAADDEAAQEDVDAATANLRAALDSLRKLANKDALNAAIASVEKMDLSKYTAASVSNLNTILAKAKAMAADASLTEEDQKQVDIMTADLQDAKDDLKTKNTASHSSSSSKGSSGSSASSNVYSSEGTAVVTTGTSVAATASVVSDTTVNFTLRRGSAYCFKMTVQNSNTLVPNFTVGDGSVLKTQFVTKIGNDYYYRVWAVGTPGQSTGVYTTLPGQNAQKHCTVTIG
ncbi:glycoside hydrolase family 3 N-terminal domain-containing protein [Clostridium sp. D33t1_170424_F3]|uniref:beta-glucosidase family protein n=1 Tax=Clostridium sp. D33t1_170424_F3 TaxID=2787099 RepID=UPI0018A98F22|nr:glycoside hydrolase family 3 N-terminal domain-containing protein [Clostridium sp. D33t1_170424_F3]